MAVTPALTGFEDVSPAESGSSCINRKLKASKSLMAYFFGFSVCTKYYGCKMQEKFMADSEKFQTANVLRVKK